MAIRGILMLLCLVFAQLASAAPKVKKVLVAFGEHVSFGTGLYFAGAYAAGGQHPNWQAGLTVAGAAAAAKEFTDLHDHKEKPKSKTALDIGEIMAGAGVAAAVKH